jgi:hypothetical protein
VTAPLAGWHTVEHAYISSVYLSTGLSGTPDLHGVYNLVESVPLFVAFFGQVRRSTRRPARA